MAQSVTYECLHAVKIKLVIEQHICCYLWILILLSLLTELSHFQLVFLNFSLTLTLCSVTKSTRLYIHGSHLNSIANEYKWRLVK